VAVRVTDVPAAKFAVQVCPQLMAAGLLVTEPCPPPAFCTVNWKVEVEDFETDEQPQKMETSATPRTLKISLNLCIDLPEPRPVLMQVFWRK
jgi:hypothetical protein